MIDTCHNRNEDRNNLKKSEIQQERKMGLKGAGPHNWTSTMGNGVKEVWKSR